MIDSFGDSNANFKEGIPIDNEDLIDTSEKINRKKEEGVLLLLIHIVKEYYIRNTVLLNKGDLTLKASIKERETEKDRELKMLEHIYHVSCIIISNRKN